MTALDRLQVQAFHARYKLLWDLPRTERFVTAICETSDDIFQRMLQKNPELVKKWVRTYGRKHRR